MKKKSTDGNIIWLASYPKSGNTWLRIFLYNLLKKTEDLPNLASLNETGYSIASRSRFEKLIGIDSGNLYVEELENYMPKVLKIQSKLLEKQEFVKTHCCFSQNKKGEWLFPEEVSFRAVYLIRNPLDVCISYSHHCGIEDYDLSLIHI